MTDNEFAQVCPVAHHHGAITGKNNVIVKKPKEESTPAGPTTSPDNKSIEDLYSTTASNTNYAKSKRASLKVWSFNKIDALFKDRDKFNASEAAKKNLNHKPDFSTSPSSRRPNSAGVELIKTVKLPDKDDKKKSSSPASKLKFSDNNSNRSTTSSSPDNNTHHYHNPLRTKENSDSDTGTTNSMRERYKRRKKTKKSSSSSKRRKKVKDHKQPLYKIRTELVGLSDRKLIAKNIVTSFTEVEMVLIKEAWHKIQAWKDMFMEAMFYRAILLTPSFGDAIDIEFESFPEYLHGFLDLAARALHPETEQVQKEAYRAVHPHPDKEFNTMEEYADHFAHMAVTPIHWYSLQEAWMYALSTHSPYFEEPERTDLSYNQNSVLYRFFGSCVMQPAFTAYQQMHKLFKQEPFLTQIPEFWKASVNTPERVLEMGQNFYETLLEKYPSLLHFFSSADMDHLSIHLSKTLDIVFKSIYDFPNFIPILKNLGQTHKSAMIPSWTYALIGSHLIEVLKCPTPEVERAVGYVYSVLARIQQSPILAEEKLIGEAEKWLKDYAKEMNWTPEAYDKRFLEICNQVASSGTYSHNSEELEHGAKVAWRNSVKCIGRISWNTLLVRDMRHVIDPFKIFEECKEHQKIATGGASIQSVMTIFAPRAPRQHWGMPLGRFCRKK
eukprot:TRINITY_DN1398_c2_g1_i1.p1 TRINITY_DN1398_c2_g1~~TRINITY_DN1398_c2_g1_i1.p1  ORF type:complete len:667 (-),score=140.25 TRINITY_DN1398_c2_g1_i1:659-2659(-)